VSYGEITDVDVKKINEEFSKLTVPQIKERNVSGMEKLKVNLEARIDFYKKENVPIIEKQMKNYVPFIEAWIEKLGSYMDKLEGQVKLVNFIKLGVAVDFLYLSLDADILPEHITVRYTTPDLTKKLKTVKNKVLKVLNKTTEHFHKVHNELWANVHDEVTSKHCFN